MLTVEERECLYYKGNSIVSFDNPLYSSQCTSGAPYFRDEYIYSKASNEKYPNTHQQINYLASNKIDFSQYKGVVIKKKLNRTGIDSGYGVRPTQTKHCNSWGAIDHDIVGGAYLGRIPTVRGKEDYYDISDYNNEAYLYII